MRVCFSLFKYRYISIYIYIYMTFMSACMSVLLEKMRGGLDEGWRLQGIFHCTASALPSVIYDVSSAVEAMLQRIARKNVQINVERKNKQTKNDPTMFEWRRGVGIHRHSLSYRLAFSSKTVISSLFSASTQSGGGGKCERAENKGSKQLNPFPERKKEKKG